MERSTERLKPDDAGLARAAALLREGRTVVFPTETVFGLGANALMSEAVRGIYRAKGRPSDNPLIVHVGSLDQASLVTEGLTEAEHLLFSVFSPGPLTLVVRRHPDLAPETTAGLPTVGLRIPSHPVARRLLQAAAVPVAAPSANRSGRPSPTNADMAWADMEGHADAVLEGEPSSVGLESTIAWLEGGRVHVLRPGSISGAALVKVLRDAGLDWSLAEADRKAETPQAPGTRYRHYSPQARVHLAGPDTSWDRLTAQAAADPATAWFWVGPRDRVDPVFLGTCKGQRCPESTQEFARSLYRCLVEADHEGMTDVVLWLEPSRGVQDPDAGLVEALRDRCRRAAGLLGGNP